MAEEIAYRDGDIVWVKMNKLWWPGEVHGSHRLPSDFFDQFKKPPLVVVKFFQEHNYHYVNQLNQIAEFNCAKKSEFIKKGLDLYYAKHQYMEEFPADVAIAEKRTGGNPNIIYSKEFMPATKPDKSIPGSASKGTTSRSRRGQQNQTSTPSIPRVMIKPDHDTRILVPTSPSTSLSPTVVTTDSKYKCTLCNFSTNRINTLIWHQKTHNSPKTPSSIQKSEPTFTLSTENVEVSKPTPVNTAPADEKMDLQDEKIDLEEEESIETVAVIVPEKTPGKRLRQTKESRSKSNNKAPKTENKLKNLLDDWSDDEITEAGPSGITPNKNANSIVVNSDDEDDVVNESSVKKKLKFSNENENGSTVSDANETEVFKNKPEVESDDLSQNIVSENTSGSVVEDKTENRPRLGKRNLKNETTSRQSGRIKTKDITNDEAQTPTRHLRSGKPINEQNAKLTTPTPKRRGRSAKRNTDDAVESEDISEKINESEIKPLSPNKTETINDIKLSPSEKVSDESVTIIEVDQASGVKRSNSKTSRKGKPRRKEEIKLANNISVAVLVEKTTSSQSTDKGIEQKQDLPTDDSEYTNVVHKKIRYMSHSSTDDHRKSIETPKLPETEEEFNNETEGEMIVETSVEISNHTEDEAVVTTKESIDSNVQNEENNVEPKPNDVLQEVSISEQADVKTTSISNLDLTEFTEEIVERSESADEHRFTQKCYMRKTSQKSNISLESDVPTEPLISSTDDVDKYDLPSSSNLRQRAPKRYENTKNRRKSERRKDSESSRAEDFTAIVKAIDNECEKSDRTRQKSVEMNNDDTSKLPEISNDSCKEEASATHLLDQSSENSNSKTSTPEKADTSKELDCFDFTEDEYLKVPPQVLNRRKRLPPAKVFELEDINKIEEQRKLDEEAIRIAQLREEENQKLQAELENLLNTTTPAVLPEIPTSHKAHENFPERRAEKDPEKLMLKDNDIKDRMLPPKERNKRIFKYRNRNRRTDSDVKVTNTSCDVEDNKGNNLLHSEKIVETSVEEKYKVKTDKNQVQSKNRVLQTDKNKNPSAHDLKIEIAETLINFPLLSPQTDKNEQLNKNVVGKTLPSKSKEYTKSARTVKKLKSAATIGNRKSKIVPASSQEESTKLPKQSNEVPPNATKESNKSVVHDNGQNSKLHVPNNETLTNNPMNSTPSMSTTSFPKSNDSTLFNETLTKSINKPSINASNIGLTTQTTETATASTITKPVRDFSRIRLIEKIENNTSIQSTEQVASSKTHPLPLKKTVILTQTDGNSFITRIPKKRKSQMDDDIPAFVIERPKDSPDDINESNNQHPLTKKEPKSFIVTKTIQKQITGELPKQNISLIAGGGVLQNSKEINEGIDGSSNQKLSQQEANTNVNLMVNPTISSVNTQTSAASDVSSIESPVIVSRVVHKNSHSTSGQKTSKTEGKRAVISSPSAASSANILGNISIANRPCTIAPAKKASYRKPTDMTGLTQKQIGIDGKGNPVMIYTKITPVVTQTPPIISQSTFVMKRNEPVPSTSQLIQSFTTPVQSNQGNQFVITSKGALITNKPFITTTHSTLLNQPTLTNRPNIQVHTQLIRSPNPQVFQQQHPPPQSNQILIQTKPTNILSQVSSIAPVKRQQTNRRSVVNKAKATEMIVPEQSNDRISNPSSYRQVMTEDNSTLKKRVVRRISKNQSTATATQQHVILNAEINHIGNAATPVPPLVPLNDPSPSISSRKQPTKQPPTQTMTFIQEPQTLTKTPHVEVVEQQQENIQEILALPGDTPGFGGPPGSYFLCKLNEMGVYIPIDHQPLYLDVTDNTNLLKPNVPDGSMAEMQAVEMNETEIVSQQSPALFELNNVSDRVITNNQAVLSDQDVNNPKYLINISDGQQLLADQQSLMALANGEEFPQFVTSDGHQIILQGGQHDILSAIAFAEDVGLIAGQQILIPEDDLAVIQGQSGNHDILATALAGTEAFSQEQFIDNVLIQSNNGVEDIIDPMVFHQRHPRQQPTVAALTNETNAVLTQPPIMSTLEQPTKTDRLSPNNAMELIGQNLDESLAVIGVTSNTKVPTSLELPITITNPAIAPKTTSITSAIYPPTGSTDHNLDYDIFTSSLPISHHLTQSLAINENYRTVNVINSIGDIDLDSNIVAVATTNDHQSFGRD